MEEPSLKSALCTVHGEVRSLSTGTGVDRSWSFVLGLVDEGRIRHVRSRGPSLQYHVKLGMVLHSWSASTQEVEAGEDSQASLG